MRTVLVVDDNPDHRYLTMRAARPLLSELDLRLVQAADGDEALALVRGEKGDGPTPALVLLDIKMPRRDGFQVLEALRADPRTAAIAVVMFTSSENAGDVERAKALGADDYVTKPLDPQAFAEVVQVTLRAWSARLDGWTPG